MGAKNTACEHMPFTAQFTAQRIKCVSQTREDANRYVDYPQRNQFQHGHQTERTYDVGIHDARHSKGETDLVHVAGRT